MQKQKIYQFIEGEVLLIDKPAEWTSFDVVNYLRKAIRRYHDGCQQRIKVGHAGTLDYLATGLLIVCTGKLTKQIDHYQAEEKEYEGTMVLGASTPSYDMEMPVDKTAPFEFINKELLEKVKEQFTGKIQQKPPVYSAVKIDGKRAYQYARDGEEVKTRTRTVEIKEFEITHFELPEVGFKVVCSKGTYIRSLVNDFGLALQSRAYLKSLRRTRIGNFLVKNAKGPKEMVKQIDEIDVSLKNNLKKEHDHS